MSQETLKPLSDALFDPVSRAYKAGGLALAFLTLGAFLMLVAFLRSTKDTASYVILCTGFILVISTCLLFFLKDIRPLFNAQKSIDQNRELIDAIQRTALEVTELASVLQALAFKHASELAAGLHVLRPQIRALPVIGKLADSDLIVRTDSLSSAIVEYTSKTKQVIEEVKTALVSSDPQGLQKYLEDLREIRGEVEQTLRAGS
jgi:hypothetical protein